MFAELISEDITEVAQRYGYDIKIEKRDDSYDLCLIYPDYCLNDPLRITTFSDEFTPQQMLRDSDTVRKYLKLLKETKMRIL